MDSGLWCWVDLFWNYLVRNHLAYTFLHLNALDPPWHFAAVIRTLCSIAVLKEISSLGLQTVRKFVPAGSPWIFIQNQRIIILLIHYNDNALKYAADCPGRDN